jgi:hypothetical protein
MYETTLLYYILPYWLIGTPCSPPSVLVGCGAQPSGTAAPHKGQNEAPIRWHDSPIAHLLHANCRHNVVPTRALHSLVPFFCPATGLLQQNAPPTQSWRPVSPQEPSWLMISLRWAVRRRSDGASSILHMIHPFTSTQVLVRQVVRREVIASYDIALFMCPTIGLLLSKWVDVQLRSLYDSRDALNSTSEHARFASDLIPFAAVFDCHVSSCQSAGLRAYPSKYPYTECYRHGREICNTIASSSACTPAILIPNAFQAYTVDHGGRRALLEADTMERCSLGGVQLLSMAGTWTISA